MKQTWNPALYDTKHDFVSKYGEDVVALLAPVAGERILDLGCGTGDLAELIAKSGAVVTGMDSSVSMIETAREKFPDMKFEVGSASEFLTDEPYDAVFSNATLHWVLEYEKAVSCMYKSLKPGGRLVLEMGGKGNVNSIVVALGTALANAGFEKNADAAVWYFPSLSAYTTLLESTGFRVQFAAHFDRPTELKEDNGIKNWLRMFGSGFFKGMTDEAIEPILTTVQDELRPKIFRDGKWIADYVRLRIMAVKL